MIRPASKRPVSRPEACKPSPAVLSAVNRWMVSMPAGELSDVDRAVIAVLLSYGGHLEHDPALSASLALLERIRQTLRKLLGHCDRNTDVQRVNAAIDFVADASGILRSIEPHGLPRLESAGEGRARP